MQRMKLDDVKKLHQKKYREEFGCFLAEGEHLVQELEKAAASNKALQASELYVTEHYADWETQFHKHRVTERAMQQLSETKSPQGIVARVPTSALQQLPRQPRAVYLYEAQDPGNLGTILRTLGWFGGFECLLSPGCVDPFNSKVVRASMGAIFYVPLTLDASLDAIKSDFRHPAYLALSGQPLNSDNFRNTDCLIFGNEARGIPEDLLANSAASTYSIPGCGQIDSLNLSASVNMCIYELMRA